MGRIVVTWIELGRVGKETAWWRKEKGREECNETGRCRERMAWKGTDRENRKERHNWEKPWRGEGGRRDGRRGWARGKGRGRAEGWKKAVGVEKGTRREEGRELTERVRGSEN